MIYLCILHLLYTCTLYSMAYFAIFTWLVFQRCGLLNSYFSLCTRKYLYEINHGNYSYYNSYLGEALDPLLHVLLPLSFKRLPPLSFLPWRGPWSPPSCPPSSWVRRGCHPPPPPSYLGEVLDPLLLVLLLPEWEEAATMLLLTLARPLTPPSCPSSSWVRRGCHPAPSCSSASSAAHPPPEQG